MGTLAPGGGHGQKTLKRGGAGGQQGSIAEGRDASRNVVIGLKKKG